MTPGQYDAVASLPRARRTCQGGGGACSNPAPVSLPTAREGKARCGSRQRQPHTENEHSAALVDLPFKERDYGRLSLDGLWLNISVHSIENILTKRVMGEGRVS